MFHLVMNLSLRTLSQKVPYIQPDNHITDWFGGLLYSAGQQANEVVLAFAYILVYVLDENLLLF